MPILVLCLLVVPLATAVVVALLGARSGPAVRWVSLGSTLASAAIAVVIAVPFAALPRVQATQPETPLPDRPDFRPEMSLVFDLVPLRQVGGSAIQFFIGIDGLNVWLVVLTAVLMVSAVLVSWNAVRERVNEFYA